MYRSAACLPERGLVSAAKGDKVRLVLRFMAAQEKSINTPADA